MYWKLRLLIAYIKILMLPFTAVFAIMRLINWVTGRTADSGGDGVTLYRRSNDGFEFVHAVAFKDQILEQRGFVGEETPRTYHPLDQRDEVFARVDALLNDGFVNADEFDGFRSLEIAAPVSEGFASGKEFDFRNEFWDVLDAFLADTGLGSVIGASSGSGTMELETEVVDVEKAKSAIVEFIQGTKFASFTIMNSDPVY